LKQIIEIRHRIRRIAENKKEFLPLLLLGDEIEDGIVLKDKVYLERRV